MSAGNWQAKGEGRLRGGHDPPAHITNPRFHPGARVVWIDRDGEPRPVVVRGLGSLRGRLRSGTAGRSLRAALTEERAAERVREDA